MNRHAPSGFTLTELLAVIGIIATLSMQMPYRYSFRSSSGLTKECRHESTN